MLNVSSILKNQGNILGSFSIALLQDLVYVNCIKQKVGETMPFQIIRNDITKLEVDAIVNAANSGLKAGGGVCGAIFAAAGAERLQAACDKIGFCATGDAVITPGFDLMARYVIHTVGPIYGKNPAREEDELFACYARSLALAKRKRLKSIAFPVIASGIFGYPKTEALRIASKAIRAFLEENEMDVYLVVYDRAAFQISEKLFEKVESYIEERMVKIQRREQREFNVSISLSEDEAFPTCTAPCASKPVFSRCADAMPAPKLKQKRTLEDLLKRKAETFSQMLLRMIDEKNMTDVEVYKRANIDRKLFSKIRKKDYVPKKTTVLALVIALRLNMQEARMLLERAGYAFTQSSEFDIIIEFFIENQNYDIFEINETLFAFEQQLLGA